MLEYLEKHKLLRFKHIDVAIGRFFQKSLNILKSLVVSLTRRPNVILVESVGIVAFIGLMCRILARGKLVIRVKGNIYQEYDDSKKSKSFLYKLYKYVNFQASKIALKYCDLLLPISMGPLLEIERRMGLEKPSQVVYITPRVFEETIDENINVADVEYVITVTNFNFYKKVQPLVAAIKKILPRLSEYGYQWIILGDGKYLKAIKDEVSAEIETGFVKFVGVENPNQYYSEARAHFYFSGLDSLSNSLLESYYFKVPVLLNHDFPVMGESAIANENVLIIDLDNDDQDLIHSKLEQILLDKNIRSKLINNSLDLLEQRFSLKSVSDSLWQAVCKNL